MRYFSQSFSYARNGLRTAICEVAELCAASDNLDVASVSHAESASVASGRSAAADGRDFGDWASASADDGGSSSSQIELHSLLTEEARGENSGVYDVSSVSSDDELDSLDIEEASEILRVRARAGRVGCRMSLSETELLERELMVEEAEGDVEGVGVGSRWRISWS